MLTGFGLGYLGHRWLNKTLPDILNRSPERPYQIRYRDFSISLWTRRLAINGITVVPAPGRKDSAGIQAHADRFLLTGLSLRQLLLQKVLKADRLLIVRPVVGLAVNNPARQQGDTLRLNLFLRNVLDRIEVLHINLEDGTFSIRDFARNTAVFTMPHYALQLDGVMADSMTVASPFPFRYRTLSFEGRDITYHCNPHYRIHIARAEVRESSLRMDSVRLLPLETKSGFQQAVRYQQDRYELRAPAVQVDSVSWGFQGDSVSAWAKALHIRDADFHVYRDRRKPQAPFRKKPLTNAFFRSLPFLVRVDSFFIENTRITYEEHPASTRAPGEVVFSSIKARGGHLTNDPAWVSRYPELVVDAHSLFMNTSRLHALFRIGLDSPRDSFVVKGSLGRITAGTLNQTLVPLAGVAMHGRINSVDFDIRGDDIRAYTTFRMLYDSIRLEVLQKGNYKTSWLGTIVTNLFMRKKNSPREEAPMSTGYSFTRYQDRSFFNYLWNCIKKGSLNTILKAENGGLRKNMVDQLMEKSSPAYQRSHPYRPGEENEKDSQGRKKIRGGGKP